MNHPRRGQVEVWDDPRLGGCAGIVLSLLMAIAVALVIGCLVLWW